MARSANMQAMTNDLRAVYPGVVVYGIGDRAHQLEPSDHNEDDTTGSRPAQSDPDGRPEHRAIDAMLGPAFTRADAYAVINQILADPAALARLRYIIFDGWIWSRSNGWTKGYYTGSNRHTDHIHFSGLAADDENSASWPSIYGSRGGNGMFCRYGDTNEYVRLLQWQLAHSGVPDVGAADASYGPKTAAAVAWMVKAHDGSTQDGRNFGSLEALYLAVRWAKRWSGPAGPPGKDGRDGADGAPGAPGRDGVLHLPETIAIQAYITPEVVSQV